MEHWEISGWKVGFWILMILVLLIWRADVHPIKSTNEYAKYCLKNFGNAIQDLGNRLDRNIWKTISWSESSRGWSGYRHIDEPMFKVLKLGMILIFILGLIRIWSNWRR